MQHATLTFFRGSLLLSSLLILFFLLSTPFSAHALDPDALSQRFRNWTYYPDWIIPPVCLNPHTCSSFCNTQTGAGCVVDVFQLIQLPSEQGTSTYRGVYLQFDGVGYETYMATTTDKIHFNLSAPGVIFSPRSGRPPLSWNATPGDFDYGGIAFVGPVVHDYNLSTPKVLRATKKDGRFYYAYDAYPSYGYESAPGADGMAYSVDGLNWERAIPLPFLDTKLRNGAQPWEQGQVYAPFLTPTPSSNVHSDNYNDNNNCNHREEGDNNNSNNNGISNSNLPLPHSNPHRLNPNDKSNYDSNMLAAFYNAGSAKGNEQSGAAYLPGGIEALPGFDFTYNISLWVRDPLNPLLPNDALSSYQASDPKVYYDDVQHVWVLLYFCNGGETGGADICIAFSENQRTWLPASSPLYKHGGHPKGLDSCHAHKVWVSGSGVAGDDTLYMYYTGVMGPGCNTRGILLLTSKPLP